MPKHWPKFFQQMSFQRQIGLTVTVGLLFLALFSSLTESWQVNTKVRDNTVEQGRHITENLARQSALALVFSSAANADDAVSATLTFPGVVGVEIRHANGEVLLSRGEVGSFSHPVARHANFQMVALMESEDEKFWHFSAPVYSQPIQSPFGDNISPEWLGQVFVVMSKEVMSKTATKIIVTNLLTSFSFALLFLFLFLMRRMTHNMMLPLDQLSDSMARARQGESQVRVEPEGPSDIVEMGHAFNRMMSDLEEREAALRVAAIAFETEEAMMVTDEKVRLIRVNHAFSRMTGFSAEEVIGKSPSILKSERQGEDYFREMWHSLRVNNNWQGEIWNRRKNGEIFPAWLNITAVIGKDGNVSNYVGSFIDFTERKQAENEIHHLAFYDTLSQLPNRRLLLDRLRQAVASGSRNGTGGALLFIDLDNFKTLNDTKGHGIGDLLLIEVAKRLQACVREGDTVARFGGDEFVLLLEGLSSEPGFAAAQARVVGEKVQEHINRPYMLDDVEFHSSSSMGITLFFDYQQSLDDLLKQADTAMYEAKRSGRNTLRFFDPVMQEALEARTQIEAGLREALRNEEFRLYYQMQVNQAGKIVGAEALLRWIHPERGLIPPLQFIRLDEENGMILPIGKWVLQEACRQILRWSESESTRDLVLAINVSARQFRQADFVSQLTAIIEQAGIDPSRLKLELTESIVLDDVGDSIVKMQALRRLGLSFSMDDFGTGYSSLAYLTQLPLDQLKIDQSFVRHLNSKASDATIVQTIIGMASNLGMDVIAEGVETAEQRDFLEANGCYLYQGYLFGRPVPLEEFNQLLVKNRAR